MSGVAAAIMRLSPNGMLELVAAGHTWPFRARPLILQFLTAIGKVR